MSFKLKTINIIRKPFDRLCVSSSVSGSMCDCDRK